MRKIILFELNEVPYKVLDYYCQKFPQSQLAQIFHLCKQYETETTDSGHLSPWITWPTLHRGVDNSKHGIHDFGEDLSEVDKKYPPIWKMLKEQGVSTGVFASMHSFPNPKDYKEYAFYVPDPFAGDSEAHPPKVVPFQKFNLAMSRKSGRNVDTGIDMKAAIDLGLSLPGLGIKIGTMTKVANQLVTERIKPHLKTRRRSYQSVLAFDVFIKLMKKTKPQFATCFSNHVASAMHRYWAAAFPNDYTENNMDADWLEKYSEEVDFSMHQFDAFLKAMVSFAKANPEYQIWFASSMGQAPTQANMLRTEVYCKDLSEFITKLGLQPKDWEQKPAMHPQYNLTVNTDKVEVFKEILSQVEIADKPLSFREKDGGFFSIDLGHKNLDDEKVVFKGEALKLADLALSNEPIDDETGSTAYHVKEGTWWIYDPQSKERSERIFGVPSTTIAPLILRNFDLPVPEYMVQETVAV